MFYTGFDGVERKVTTKCEADDTYNKERGLEISIAKAFNKETERFLKKVRTTSNK